jgi:hypothetical protein
MAGRATAAKRKKARRCTRMDSSSRKCSRSRIAEWKAEVGRRKVREPL